LINTNLSTFHLKLVYYKLVMVQRVSRIACCCARCIVYAQRVARQGPDDVRLPPRRHSSTPRRPPSTPVYPLRVHAFARVTCAVRTRCHTSFACVVCATYTCRSPCCVSFARILRVDDAGRTTSARNNKLFLLIITHVNNINLSGHTF
jgi:hypothetical protein